MSNVLSRFPPCSTIEPQFPCELATPLSHQVEQALNNVRCRLRKLGWQLQDVTELTVRLAMPCDLDAVQQTEEQLRDLLPWPQPRIRFSQERSLARDAKVAIGATIKRRVPL